MQAITLFLALTLLCAIKSCDGWFWGRRRRRRCYSSNCHVSSWSYWGRCSQNCGNAGTQSRERHVTRAQSCGGTCYDQLSETSACNRRCCPVNCVWSWGNWGACQGCGTGNRSRNVVVSRISTCGGTACPGSANGTQFCNTGRCCPVNCAVSSWGNWGSCNAQCEQTGTRSRTRRVTTAVSCNGTPCPQLTQHNSCNGPCCRRDCVLSSWTSVGSCTAPAGACSTNSGRLTQRRTVVTAQSCGGTCPSLQRTISCTPVPIQCQVSNWGAWGTCTLKSGSCGAGTQARTRTITTQPYCAASCPATTESRNCVHSCCPVDCVLSQWTAWGTCSANCGLGSQIRTRRVQTPASCNGRCSSVLSQTQSCTVTRKIDCQLGPWTAWSICNSGCGNGIQQRSRTVTVRPTPCGQQCGGLSEIKQCQSYRENRDCQVGNWMAWQRCDSNCSYGTKERFRSVTVTKRCNGALCPTLKDTAACGLPNGGCQQLCRTSDGACSCFPGYKSTNRTHCTLKDCGQPTVNFCPLGEANGTVCKQPWVTCPNGRSLFRSTCTLSCPPTYRLKGLTTISCEADGGWTKGFATTYCRRINDPASDIILSGSNSVPENSPSRTLVGSLSSVDVNPSDNHTYAIVPGRSYAGKFEIIENELYTLVTFDYESGPKSYSIGITSTDNGNPSLSFTKYIIVSMDDVNEEPTNIILSSLQIAENSDIGTVVGLFDTIDVDIGQKNTYTLIDSANGMFRVNNNALQAARPNMQCLHLGSPRCPFNYEKTNSYLIEILSSDVKSPSFNITRQFNITVINTNDPPYDVKITGNTVKENDPNGTVVGKLAAIDEDMDPTQSVMFSMVDDDNGRFGLTQSGVVFKTEGIDYEKDQSHMIRVRVTDNGTPPASNIENITIIVLDVNEPPVNITITPAQPIIAENSAIGTVIGEIEAYDSDFITSLNMTLDIDAGGRFKVENNVSCSKADGNETQAAAETVCKVKLMVNGGLNFERSNVHTITVRAEDRGHFIHRSFNIQITDANDPPRILLIDGKSFAEVPENSPRATIGILSTHDEDANQTHTFALADDTDDMLVIEGETLKLNTNQSYNYETKQSYTVEINVTDDGIPQASALFPIIIKVTNVNEAPTDIQLSANSIEENSPEGAAVANITVVDPDDVVSNSTARYHTCRLLDSAGGRFKVLNGLTLAVGSGVLNYEQISNYTVTAQCSDGALTVSKSFTITVTDVNEKPTSISLSANKVPENLQSRYLIGYLSTVDPDNLAETTQTFTYGIRGNDSRFDVAGNALYGIMPFDYEIGSMVYAKVSSTDDGSPPLTRFADIRVEVTDVNDAPNDIVISSDRVDENSPLDTVVGTLSTVDQDLNQKFTYNLIDSADGRFKIENGIVKVAVSNADCLKLGGTHCSLNFENKKNHVIQIKTTDDGSPPLSFTKNMTIYLNDVNDRPRDIQLSNYTVQETAPVNHVIGKFTVSDEDSGQTVTYTLTEDDEGHFGVDSGGNLYKASNKTNFETSKSHKITVKITDNGSPLMSISKNFTIEVLDVNEAPIITKITNENGQLKFQESKPKVEENSQRGTVIGTIVSYESEAVDKIIFGLDDNAGGVFVLGGNITCRNISNVVGARSMCSVQLILNDLVNFETKASYSILIRSTDSQGLFHVQKFTVEIVDKNDAPTGISIGGLKYAIVSENQPGTLVDDMTTTDEDSSQSHVYALLGNNSAMFNIYNTNLFLSRGIGFDYEQQTVHKVMLNSTDSGQPPLSVIDTLELRVIDVNEAPTDISLDGNNVVENSPRGTVIGNLSVTDPDNMGSKGNWQSHTCSVSSGGAGLFTVQDLKLVVAHNGLDFERVPTLNISVRCEDSGRPVQSIEKWFVINVQDINERPTSISISNSFVAENTPPGGIGMLSTRDPDNFSPLNFIVQSFTYSFVNTDASVPFEIAGNILRTTKQLNFENQSSWILNIRSTDDGAPSLSVDNIVVINVTDVNEQPTNIALSSANVNENAAMGTKIGLLTTLDPDRDQSFSYSLVDSANGLFRVNNSQIEVAVDNKVCLSRGGNYCPINYEKLRNIDIRVQSKDSGNPQLSIEKVITIKVNDVNDRPRDLLLSANNLPENATKGFQIGQLTVTDEDDGQNVTFRLTNDDNGRFTVNRDGFIVKAKDTNYENQKIHKITVEASDNGSPVLKVTKDFVIIVQDVNEAPTKIEISSERGQIAFPKNSAHVNENSAKGVIVGTFYAYDEDAVEKLTFSLDDNANGSFSVANPASCSNTTANGKSKHTVCKALLMVAGAIDFETDATKSIIIRVTDNKGLSHSQLFTVTTIDKNDRPTDISINGLYNGFVNENQANTLIGTLQTQDEDVGQRHSYRIINDPAVTFIISGGKIYTSPHAALNYERKSKYTLLVETVDNGSPAMSYQRNLTVQVLDVNEAPTDFQLTSNGVNENSAIGTLVGNITVSDPDNEGKHAGTQKASCQIVPDFYFSFKFNLILQTDASAVFEIKNDIQLVVKKASLNFERISSYSIKVRCYDNGIPRKYMRKRLTINVNDINEAPTGIILTNGDIRENVPSATVGRCVVSDPDRTRQTFVLRVTDNKLPFTMFGNVLKTTRPLNYEQKHVYKISVMAIDQGGLSVTENFTVNVQDLNDRPSNILFNGALEIQENSNAGALVAIASAVDEDFYQLHRYAIQSIVGFGQQSTRSLPGYFTIGSTTGRILSATSVIDHEEFKAINISVTATDNGRPSMSITKIVTIRVTDVNHPPTDIRFNGRNVVENSPLGFVVGTFTVLDPDNKFTQKQTFTCNLKSDDMIPFTISRKISLTVDGVVDYEKKQSYVIRVTCIEDHVNPYNITKSFVVTVLNINEAPTDINITSNTVAENQDAGAFIGTITAVDPDNKLTYVNNVTIQLLPQLDGASFRLVGGNSLISNQKFNYEQKNTFAVKIRASDNGQPALSSEQILNILVTDVNDRPTDITLSAKIVAENAPQGTIVGQLSTTDDDAGQTYVYSFISTIDNLSIHGNKILVAGKLDYETEPQINIIIRVTDSGNPALTYQKSFNITVTDANDPPSDIIATIFPVPENNTVDRIIANLKLVDEDRNQHVRSCSMINNPGDFYFQNGASSDKINMFIKRTAALDYETAPNINVTVQCFDNGRPSRSIQKKISIQVLDSNDKPTGILINGSTIMKLPENSPIESVVGPLSCIDQDAGQSHQYELQSGGDIFMVQEKANLLLVKNNSRLDYEKLSSPKQLPVSIKVTDSGHPSMSFTSTIQIEVTDVNEAPSNVRLIHTLGDKIPENVTSGTHIGELFADNPEGFRQQLSYSVLNWNETFAITESHGPGKVSFLTVKGELNFDREANYDLTVKVTDNGIPALSAQNIITVNVERTDPCYSGTLDCGREICQRINKTNGNCGCLAGYEPKKGACVNIDDCKSNCLYCEDSTKACQAKKECPACYNNATCNDKLMSYNCGCLPGFTDDRCETNIDDCANKPCRYGTCFDLVNSYQCECNEGYEGRNCETNIDECKRGECVKADCTDLVAGFSCRCQKGATGLLCSRREPDCMPGPCGQKRCVAPAYKDLGRLTKGGNEVLCASEEQATILGFAPAAVPDDINQQNKWKYIFREFIMKLLGIPFYAVDLDEEKSNGGFYSPTDVVIYPFSSKAKRSLEATDDKKRLPLVVKVQNKLVPRDSFLRAVNKTCANIGKSSKYWVYCEASYTRIKELGITAATGKRPKTDKSTGGFKLFHGNNLYMFIGGAAGLVLIIAIILMVVARRRRSAAARRGSAGSTLVPRNGQESSYAAMERHLAERADDGTCANPMYGDDEDEMGHRDRKMFENPLFGVGKGIYDSDDDDAKTAITATQDQGIFNPMYGQVTKMSDPTGDSDC